MSVFLVFPVQNQLPSFKYKINLSGTNFTLEFRFNGRMQRWMMNINDASNNTILSGIPMLIIRNFTIQYAYLALPAGTMFVTDDTGKGTQPTQYSFGSTNTFWYLDPTQ